MFQEYLHTLELGHGLLDAEGRWHRCVVFEPISGHQEALFGALPEPATPQSIDELLAACINRIGEFRTVSTRHAAALTRGDRERLALELRILMFGDRLFLSLYCPNPVCGEPADLDLSIDEIIDEMHPDQPQWISVHTPDGEALLRQPTGVDDAAYQALGQNRRVREADLWSRLVARVGDCEPLTPKEWRRLQPETRHAIALALADSRSIPDLAIVTPCPTCSAWMELDLDPFVLLARELRLGADRMMVDTHCLAFHYGWGEDQILALPRHRRWRYLELLRNQIEGRPLTDGWS